MSSAIAEMAAQCCTSRIFAIVWGLGVPLFNAVFLSNHTFPKDSLAYIFIADSMGLASTTLT